METPFDSTYEKRRLLTGSDSDVIQSLNRFRLPEYWDEMQGTKQFIFMTRPDLNLFVGMDVVDNVKRIPYMNELWEDENIGRIVLQSLQQTISSFSCPWLPIITNKCTGYSPIDDEIEAIERGETYFGHKIIYGKHNLKTRSANTISMPFKDNRNLVLYKTLRVWVDYIEHVSLGLCSPRRDYIVSPQLDYAVSLYYLVTRLDMQEIIYWEKLCGVFPMNVPNSAFVHQLGNVIDPEYNVTFRYSMKDRSMNPAILSELNKIAAKSDKQDNWSFRPNWDTINKMHGEPYVETPFVVKVKNKFILRWK